MSALLRITDSSLTSRHVRKVSNSEVATYSITSLAVANNNVGDIVKPSGSRLTFESRRGFPVGLNACESGACEQEFPSLSSLPIASV